MSCSCPVYLSQQKLFVPCGRCISCRISKQSALTFLAERELETLYKSKQSATFITLTYNDLTLPINSKGLVTLRKSHLQKFLKRLRILLSRKGINQRIKYIACGESGSDTHRPHYHLVIFGLRSSVLSPLVARAWSTGSSRQGFARLDSSHKWQPIGLVQCSPLRSGGIRYITKYMTKSLSRKEIKDIYTSCETEPPFICHSCGIAKDWIRSNARSIADDNFLFILNGKKSLYPKYVRQYVTAITGISSKPAVSDFLKKSVAPLATLKNMSIRDYTLDHAIMQERLYIASARLHNNACFRPDQMDWATVAHKKRQKNFGQLLDNVCNVM